MKGTVVAVVTGLAALVAVGAAGGALLVERTLTEEATRALAAEGVDAHVTFSGLTATVSAAMPRHAARFTSTCQSPPRKSCNTVVFTQ